MQKLVSKMKTSWFAKASFVFVGIRCFSILGMSWSVLPDTQTYTVLDFTGVHTTRGWTLPLLYWIVRPNVARVAAQFLIATTAWITVAATFKKRIHHLRVQQLAVAGCFLVGVSSTVVGWDLALLSESLSISLGVHYLRVACVCPQTRCEATRNTRALHIPICIHSARQHPGARPRWPRGIAARLAVSQISYLGSCCGHHAVRNIMGRLFFFPK